MRRHKYFLISFDNLYMNSVPGVITFESDTSDSDFGKTFFPSFWNRNLNLSSSFSCIFNNKLTANLIITIQCT